MAKVAIYTEMTKRKTKKPTENVIMPHGAVTKMAEDLGVCRETISNAIRCVNKSFAAYIIQMVAIKFYKGKWIDTTPN